MNPTKRRPPKSMLSEQTSEIAPPSALHGSLRLDHGVKAALQLCKRYAADSFSKEWPGDEHYHIWKRYQILAERTGKYCRVS